MLTIIFPRVYIDLIGHELSQMDAFVDKYKGLMYQFMNLKDC